MNQSCEAISAAQTAARGADARRWVFSGGEISGGEEQQEEQAEGRESEDHILPLVVGDEILPEHGECEDGAGGESEPDSWTEDARVPKAAKSGAYHPITA